MIRTIRAAVAAGVLALVLAGCGSGSSGLDAERVVDELDGVYPVTHPRDNTEACAGDGCEQLVATGAVSVYQWPDEATAQRYAAQVPAGQVHQAGVFVLRFPDEYPSSDRAVAAWSQRLDQLVAQQGPGGDPPSGGEGM